MQPQSKRRDNPPEAGGDDRACIPRMSSQTATPRVSLNPARPFERYLAVVAALGCVAITVAVWVSLRAVQPMWPLPALYLIEVSGLSVVAAIAFVRGGRRSGIITWAAVGMLAAFCILGILSVGGLYLPTTLLLAIVGFTSGLRNKSSLLRDIGLGLVAGLAQIGVMLTVVRLL